MKSNNEEVDPQIKDTTRTRSSQWRGKRLESHPSYDRETPGKKDFTIDPQRQRRCYKFLKEGKKQPNITPEQALRLQEIGFVFDVRKQQRQQKAEEESKQKEDEQQQQQHNHVRQRENDHQQQQT